MNSVIMAARVVWLRRSWASENILYKLFDMKKLVFAFVFAFFGICAMAGVGILRPVENYIDVNNLADGVYPVAFDPSTAKVTSKGVYINFEIYSVDVFDGKLVREIAVGDNIITGNGVTDVKTIKTVDGRYIINENEAGWLDLDPQVKDTYVVCGDDDHPTYSKHGDVRLFVPVTAKMTDDGIDGFPTKSKKILGKNIGRYIKSSWSNEFCVLNTTITVKNGKVVKIHRTYIP